MQVSAGTRVSTTIELRRLDPVSAAAIAVRTICANDAYESSAVGEGLYQFSRVYRPRWATVSGWMLTVGLLGAGYWLLLIRRTESATMWISEDRARVRVVLNGGLLPDVYERLRNAFDEIESSLRPSSDFNDAERVTFDKNDDVLPFRAFRSRPAATPPVIDLVALERGEIEQRAREFEVVPSPPPTSVFDLPEVRFATGEQLRVMGVVYVGQDPMHTDASGTRVERLAVSDPTGTVSKTHFAMGANLGALWVEDLFSTTGTSVGVDAASARRVRPLERIPVPAGESIFFGDLSVLVLEPLPVD
jgi:hypothetical protein